MRTMKRLFRWALVAAAVLAVLLQCACANAGFFDFDDHFDVPSSIVGSGPYP